MRDVAEAAGVSLKTVSRVVNSEVGVSEDLVVRVESAIASLRYRPDERARNLRRADARPTSIGFALVDVANPFFSAILRGLEEEARLHNCLLLAGSSHSDATLQDQLIETFISRRVAGLVVVPAGDLLGPIAAEILHGTPVVFLDCEPAEHQSDIVRSDHYGGAAALTNHLIAHGHRHIGFVGDSTDAFSARLRVDGYRSAMEAHNLPIDDPWVLTERATPDAWRRQLRDRLARPDRPTALVTAQNFVTMGAVRALHDLDLHREIALAGFDDIEMSDVIEPGITVYPQDPRNLGRLACEMLFRRLGGAQGPPERLVIGGEIIERGSGEIPGPLAVQVT
jgi:LacI family transcriptional regulator